MRPRTTSGRAHRRGARCTAAQTVTTRNSLHSARVPRQHPRLSLHSGRRSHSRLERNRRSMSVLIADLTRTPILRRTEASHTAAAPRVDLVGTQISIQVLSLRSVRAAPRYRPMTEPTPQPRAVSGRNHPAQDPHLHPVAKLVAALRTRACSRGARIMARRQVRRTPPIREAVTKGRRIHRRAAVGVGQITETQARTSPSHPYLNS